MAALPFAMMAASAASSAVSHVQQDRMARAQKKQQERQNEAVHKDMINQYSDMSDAERQSANSIMQQSMEVTKDAMQRKSEINLMASASGTSGNSILNMSRDVDRATGRDMDTLFRNKEIEQSNFRGQANAIRTGAMRNTDTRLIQRPSAVAGMLNVGTSAAKGYMTGSDLKAKWDKPTP